MKLGSVVFLGWRGEDERFRGGAREQRQKLLVATKEKLEEMILDAWDKLLGLREGKGLDPDTWWKFRREVWGGLDPNG